LYTVRTAESFDTRIIARLSFLLLVVGCSVSLGASGRLTLRLITDGAVSFVFLPFFVVVGFGVVYFSRADRPLTFARALDLFLTGLLPWLLWLLALGIICSFVPPRRFGPWIYPLEISLILPAVWSAVLDFRFREVMGRSTGAATRDVVLYRLVGWGGATAYFLGIAIWYEVVPTALKWIAG
jgi:hypothetical protein